MKCPKCGGDLVKTNVCEVEVDRCKSCRGVWCDQDELSELLDRSNWELRQLTGSRRQESLDLQKAKCPRDNSDLMRVHSALDKDVVLDTCPNCQGIWLDAGEIDRLMNAPRD